MTDTATIRDVARHAQVSIATVSNFLNATKRIAPATSSRIQAAIDELHFVPNAAVRVMRGSRSAVLGVVVPESTNPFFAEMGRGVEDVAYEAGFVVVTCNTIGDPAREITYLKALAEMRVAGVLITPISGDDDAMKRFHAGGGSLVLVDEPPRSLDVPSVSVDDVSGGEAAVRHLLKEGAQDLLYIGGPAGPRQVNDRFEGAQRAVAAASPFVQLRRVDVDGTTTRDREAIVASILDMTPRPTGIFCANDLIALAVQGALQRRGVSIPDDILIVGFDDIPGAQLANPPLTSMRQPQYELGRTAAQILLDPNSTAPKHVVFQPALQARASSSGRLLDTAVS